MVALHYTLLKNSLGLPFRAFIRLVHYPHNVLMVTHSLTLFVAMEPLWIVTLCSRLKAFLGTTHSVVCLSFLSIRK